jgi:hypothetical protein
MTDATTSTTPMKLFIVSYQVFGHPDPKKRDGSFLLKSPTHSGADSDARYELSNYCTKNELCDFEVTGVDEIVPDTLHYEILGIDE